MLGIYSASKCAATTGGKFLFFLGILSAIRTCTMQQNMQSQSHAGGRVGASWPHAVASAKWLGEHV